MVWYGIALLTELKAQITNLSSLVMGKPADPWTAISNHSSVSSNTQRQQVAFREAIRLYYNQPVNQPARCLITGLSSSNIDIIASHIWPKTAKAAAPYHFNLNDSDRWNARNGLLLAKPLEAAFDQQRITFEYDPFRQLIVVCVVDASLLTQLINGQLTFNDIDRKEISLPRWPYRRLLNYHAECTWNKSKTQRRASKPSIDYKLQQYEHTAGRSDSFPNTSYQPNGSTTSIDSEIDRPNWTNRVEGNHCCCLLITQYAYHELINDTYYQLYYDCIA
jgi:hypothetical protein